MADGLTIPGVSDKYKTNDLVKSLMEVERVPLKREEAQLEKYQEQQNAWRDVNQKVSKLRESVKSLYSFENPFNNKNTTSSDEAALTADANRDADLGEFKVEVISEATTDRFLSGNINKNMNVEPGKYVFGVGDKTITFNWRGGKITDFVTALNKRGTDLIKASLIGVSSTKKALLIEGLKTGEESKLVFKEKALDLANQIDMVKPAQSSSTALFSSTKELTAPSTNDITQQASMPAISMTKVTADGNKVTIPSRGGIEIPLPENLNADGNQKIEFSFFAQESEDITQTINKTLEMPTLPDPGYVMYEDIVIFNEDSNSTLEDGNVQEITEKLEPIEDDNYIAIKNKDGTEIPIDLSAFSKDEETGEITVSISLDDYPDAASLVVRNSNTGKEITISVPESYDASQSRGYEPNHAIAQANDAVLKYEGITLTRPTNDIDDIIPEVTLHVHGKSEKPVTITVATDKENVKNALINFVGNYNQVITELNILTTNKPEVITELDYLTEEETEEKMKKLGMFMGDFTLTNGKASFQKIVSANYNYNNDAVVSMLNQVGISTNASGSTGYTASQLRGYLEVDEKKLDSAIDNNLVELKNIFGFDTDGDKIIDNGVGYLIDKQAASWTQAGGIISTKISALDTKIENSNKKIANLQTQLDSKEADLKAKYSNMEGTLNNLESQQNRIKNFANTNNNQ